jgi:hypothetical protein
MKMPSVANPSADQDPTARWARALLLALARDEAAGRRTPRLTEPEHATWKRFRGRLGARDFVALLFEDAAVGFPIPFDARTVGGEIDFERLPETAADDLLHSVAAANLKAPGADYVLEQAKGLGVSSRLAKSDLHVVKPHQKVLELPGTGGQLSHHLATSNPGLTLQDNFVVACGSWEERTLAGLVALDLGAPHGRFIVSAGLEELRSPKHPLRSAKFDFVVGQHPDKGGQFRAEDQLSIWFSGAKILLV